MDAQSDEWRHLISPKSDHCHNAHPVKTYYICFMSYSQPWCVHYEWRKWYTHLVMMIWLDRLCDFIHLIGPPWLGHHGQIGLVWPDVVYIPKELSRASAWLCIVHSVANRGNAISLWWSSLWQFFYNAELLLESFYQVGAMNTITYCQHIPAIKWLPHACSIIYV